MQKKTITLEFPIDRERWDTDKSTQTTHSGLDLPPKMGYAEQSAYAGAGSC